MILLPNGRRSEASSTTDIALDRRRFLTRLGGLGSGLLLLGSRFGRAQSSCDSSLFGDGFEGLAAAPAGTCVLIPSETQGPYPLLSVLSNPGIVRQDITEGRPGVPLVQIIRLVDINNGCAPIENAAVYIWHCDKDGYYSGYSQPGGNFTGQIFCRGVQYSDCNGEVAFLTMYPGWYSGRITHLHFQIYLNLAGTVTATSQLAYPPAITTAVYNSPLYVAHGQNTSVSSFANDNVFSDGVENQLCVVSGDVDSGYTAELTVGVAL